MGEEKSFSVKLSLARGYQFVASFPAFPDGNPILLDEPAPLGESKGPNATSLVAAAVGNCLAASLLFCLKKSHAEIGGLDAEVTAHLTRNERGRSRIAGIDVELSPAVPEADLARLRRCQDLFQDFCIVTESIRHGIPVNVTLGEAKKAG